MGEPQLFSFPRRCQSTGRVCNTLTEEACKKLMYCAVWRLPCMEYGGTHSDCPQLETRRSRHSQYEQVGETLEYPLRQGCDLAGVNPPGPMVMKRRRGEESWSESTARATTLDQKVAFIREEGVTRCISIMGVPVSHVCMTPCFHFCKDCWG